MYNTQSQAPSYRNCMSISYAQIYKTLREFACRSVIVLKEMRWKSEQWDVDRVSNPDRYGIKQVVSSICGLRQTRNYTECHKTFTKSHSRAIVLQVSYITLEFISDVKCLLCGFMVAINLPRAGWRVHSRCEIELVNASRYFKALLAILTAPLWWLAVDLHSFIILCSPLWESWHETFRFLYVTLWGVTQMITVTNECHALLSSS